MKMELEQLAEKVFGSRNAASPSIAKAASDNSWGKSEHYLISRLMSRIAIMDMAYVRDAEGGKERYINFIGRSKGSEAVGNVDTKLYRQNGGRTFYKRNSVGGSGIEAEGAARNGEKLPDNNRIDKRSNESAYRAAMTAEKYFFDSRDEQAALKTFDKMAADSISGIFSAKSSAAEMAEGNTVHRSAAQLTLTAISGGAFANLMPDIYGGYSRGLGGINQGEAAEHYFESKTFGRRQSLNEAAGASANGKIFTLPLEQRSGKTDRASEHSYSYGAAADINWIEDALARKLYEQIASGFPMYMR